MMLAPLIVGRKGEQADLFEELRAQGFVRIRVDGTVYELDELPKLKKNVKHTVEVVVDRLKVREDAKQRLAESFETALRHADGRALAVEMDSGREHLFSAKFACPVCSYSLPELEPRLFSFNNPMGACPRCDGLGTDQLLRSQARRRFPGALARLRRDQGLGPAQPVLLPDAAVARGPLRLRSRASVRRASGSRAAGDPPRLGPREDPLHSTSASAATSTYREHPFEGVLPNLERRYRETDSVVVREELAKYLNTQPCPECDGTRLAARSAPRQGRGQARSTRSRRCRSRRRSGSSRASSCPG